MDDDWPIPFLGGLIALVILALLAERVRCPQRCKWPVSMTGSRGALTKYFCATCRSEATSAKGRPDRCMAAVETPGL